MAFMICDRVRIFSIEFFPLLLQSFAFFLPFACLLAFLAWFKLNSLTTDHGLRLNRQARLIRKKRNFLLTILQSPGTRSISIISKIWKINVSLTIKHRVMAITGRPSAVVTPVTRAPVATKTHWLVMPTSSTPSGLAPDKYVTQITVKYTLKTRVSKN